MEQRYLIDTNSLIDAQMNRLPEKGLQFLANAINEYFTVSFITYIEFLGHKDVTTASEEFISLASIIEINKPIIDACVALRKAQKIKLPDAIIAATALVHDLVLITRNISDFKNIDGLKVMDLYSL